MDALRVIGFAPLIGSVSSLGQTSMESERRDTTENDRAFPMPPSRKPPSEHDTVKLNLSPSARKLLVAEVAESGRRAGAGSKIADESEQPPRTDEPRGITGQRLTEAERQEVDRLKKRDAEVRRHEATHAAAAGELARGGPKYEYEAGPDGKLYAVGGRVDVDTGVVRGNPEATIAKAQRIRYAALSVSDPSTADVAIAAAAAQMAMYAHAEAKPQDSLLSAKK
ncbi:MAG: hypothetical protein A3K19_33285 [Lentisphaerae bacterium RIFOXYB12_FULL_65_16]|nr:MAG: hypothetical protein A3K18_05770 [Lentisphaerae bacterium RIFOXYA12_64_32]OGV86906.1 MAG: hypothetical protein A3K19_33285 [Lentisphaerae bacterium RIFOXYB12_FULL_65_16]